MSWEVAWPRPDGQTYFGSWTVNSEDSAEDIRKRMAELRQELTCDVDDVSRSVREVGKTAKQMASPMYLIRNYPWVSAAVAAGVGYLLVPKKREVVKPDPEMLADLIRKEQIKVDTSKASSENRGLVASLAMMGITWAAKAGMNYMVQRMTAAATEHGQPHAKPTEPEPVDEPWNTTR
jgi:ElaB/YqjD/DUF883 family membrane-anchored ribosome-binding protein